MFFEAWGATFCTTFVRSFVSELLRRTRWRRPSQLREQQLPGFFGLGVAGEDEFATVTDGEVHIELFQPGELVQDLERRECWGELAQRLPEQQMCAAGEESGEGLRFNARGC